MDLNAISHNLYQVKNIINNNVKIMGIVKADAYGHGIHKISETLINSGVEYLGVATIEEALEIRKNFSIPILVLGFIPYDLIPEAINNDITQSVYDISVARQISKHAQRLNKVAKVHIKIDTGMNRLGFLSLQLDEILTIKKLPNLFVEGIFTHFSCADSDSEYTQKQFSTFETICDKLSEHFKFVYRHCCNSAATLNFPHMHMDMVRLGIIIYGLKPNSKIDKWGINLKPAMTLKTKIIHLKRVSKNSKIGYGGCYITKRDSIIGIIPVGYADGYRRNLSNSSNVLVKGNFAPVIGSICMDETIIDVTDIQDVSLFDEVILFGKQNNKEISVDEIADKLGTINYEIVSTIGKRVPRIYK